MSISKSASGSWPARAAFLATLIFASASGTMNLFYGIGKGGGDLGSSIVWGGISLAVSIVSTLSWPALLKSIDARQFSRALMVALALLLTGTYSITAALGNAMGLRTNAATTEQSAVDSRKKTQAAYDRARADLATLANAKPAGDLQGLIDGARADLAKLAPSRSAGELETLLRAAQSRPRTRGCIAIGGRLHVSCPRIEAELARAHEREKLTASIAGWTEGVGHAEGLLTQRREKLEADLARASADLAKTEAPKVANSDAVALATYLTDLGWPMTPDRLNKLLVLLAVVMVECGSGLSLAVGLSLTPPVNVQVSAAEQAQTAAPDAPERPSVRPSVQDRPASVRASTVAAWLQQRGGAARTSMRRLANELGRSPAAVHDEIGRLVAAGIVKAVASSRGTDLALAGRLN